MRTELECEAKAASLLAQANRTDDQASKLELVNLASRWSGMAAYARWQDGGGHRTFGIELLGEAIRSRFAVVDQNAELEALFEDLDRAFDDGKFDLSPVPKDRLH